jgi:apolipoprotein N-acyltransferase
MRFPKSKPSLLLAVASGVLLALAYPTFDLHVLGWLALAPLIWAILRQPPAADNQPSPTKPLRRPFFLGWMAGFVFFLATLYWLLALPIPPLFWIFLLIGYALLAAYLGLYFGVWATGFSVFVRALGLGNPLRRIVIAFLGAALWVGLEWVRSWMLTGFPWNFLGVSQYRSTPLIQIASFTGVYGVSFWVCFANIALAFTARRLWLQSRGKTDAVSPAQQARGAHRPMVAQWGAQISWEFTLAMLLVMGLGAWGLRQMMAAASQPTTTLRVALVQANVPQTLKWDESFRQKIIEDYASLTLKARESEPQLIIWPETATPDPLRLVVTRPDGSRQDRYFDIHDTLGSLARATNAHLLVGSLDMTGDEATRQTGNTYNAVFLLGPDGRIVGEPYHKMRLVVFGEYVPLERWLPFMKWLTPIPGSFAAGEEYRVFELADPPLALGAVICFEDTMPDFCRRFAARGAEVLVTVTNDAWFKRTAGAYQHAANSVFRAVENRRPLLRCANTGMTCVVNANGAIVNRLEGGPKEKIFVQGVLTDSVEAPANQPPTFYAKHGDVFAIICAALAALAWLGGGWALRKRRAKIDGTAASNAVARHPTT